MPELVLNAGSLVAGRYRLEHHLGEGGMGTVWAAQHTVTRRSVAMKFLRDTMRARPELRQRFLREAATASSLKHANVVEIIDVFDLEDSTPVMVMELLSGETLGKKLSRDERLSVEETAALMLPVISAVGTAHAHGIVHRDLKPENLFLDQSGETVRIKVLDFGIAKLTAEHYLERGMSALLTDTGSMLGTPCYMAPEQASGEHPVDQRADVWSLGVILYECLSGTRPIEGDNLAQVVSRLMSAGIMPLQRLAPELPPEITAVVTQMLSRDPARRPETLQEISTILSRYTHVRAPAFDPPSMGKRPSAAELQVKAKAPVAVKVETPKVDSPKAKVVASKDADPQGATLLSSPPVDKSIEIPRPENKGNRGLILGIGAGALVALGIAWFAFPRASADDGARAVDSSPVPVAAVTTPAATTAAPAPAPEPSASQEPAVAASAPPARTQTAAKARIRPPAPKVKTTGASDDSLFSGRK